MNFIHTWGDKEQDLWYEAYVPSCEYRAARIFVCRPDRRLFVCNLDYEDGCYRFIPSGSSWLVIGPSEVFMQDTERRHRRASDTMLD